MYSPISSMIGAIRNVIPTNMRHMSNNRHAVAIIVQRARCGKSSGSITFIMYEHIGIRRKNLRKENKLWINIWRYFQSSFYKSAVTLTSWVSKSCTRILGFLWRWRFLWRWCLKILKKRDYKQVCSWTPMHNNLKYNMLELQI